MKYINESPNAQQGPEKTGVLLVNLGTPDSPEVADVRKYLAEFLSDPRVVELPRILWKLILHGVILRIRPGKSAKAYASVWTDDGSPLLSISKKQSSALQHQLGDDIPVELAMRYGNPDIHSAFVAFQKANVRRVLVLPLYPQYSATTTASVFDGITSELQKWRRIPELRFINQYYREDGYITALAESIQQAQTEQGAPDKLLFSFHGIPKDYVESGDPYYQQCLDTADQVVSKLGLDKDQWQLSFQSRVGNKEWLKPYTDILLKEWGQNGVKKVQVICPGFSADCLETLEEIAEENKEYFTQAGGEDLYYIPALNDNPAHISMLTGLIKRHINNWE